MKGIIYILAAIFLCGHGHVSGQLRRSCGIEQARAAMVAQDPSQAQRFEDMRNSRQAVADEYRRRVADGAGERTTLVSAVPVIFHIIVTSGQFDTLGGYAGITARCDSQIAILNRDFNRQNPDSTAIPSCWKALYGNSGIHFGLAHTSPLGWGTPGYEILITSNYGFTDQYESYAMAKHASTGGLNAWDNTKYYNVWCINDVDPISGGMVLGVTVPLSHTTAEGGTSTLNEEGVCIYYQTLGNDGTGTGPSYAPYNLGRTLTHETGHFFEIWHPWGDDGGACIWSGGRDDGLADTPPEADANYGNPIYTISCGTINDGCKMDGAVSEQPIGIACNSYMDYTDDAGMHLFTADQAAAMAAMVLVPFSGVAGPTGLGGLIGENYSLTQNPSLLLWPSNTSVAGISGNSTLNVFPNATTGPVTLTFDGANSPLQEVTVVNMLGQQVFHALMTDRPSDTYSIDLSGMSRGIYFVNCNFASGVAVRKIILQ